MTNLNPSTLGLRKSFGFGDRLGLATPGHIDSICGSSFLPIFAQQSIRELKRTNRQPEDIMNAAANAIKAEGWEGIWGADADHLQTHEDVLKTAKAGYTFFTIDPSAYVNNNADGLREEELTRTYGKIIESNKTSGSEILDIYLGKKYKIEETFQISFEDKTLLLRAVVKYGEALHHTQHMYQWITEACGSKPFEVEMSVDETLTPTSPLEHLFIGLELKRMNVKVVSLAPRFIGDFEKGIDYKGDLVAFEEHYRKHVAIAKHCGPYKLSIHSGSDKFSIYPIIGRLSGNLLHVKTAGTSYLEALRCVCRTDKKLFREIINFCRKCYNKDRASYHVSAELGHIPEKLEDNELENRYLENDSGRQIMHVTFGSVLANGKASDGGTFKEKILDNLVKNDNLHRELLHKHLGKHIRLLSEN